jgi:hypothetical protein
MPYGLDDGAKTRDDGLEMLAWSSDLARWVEEGLLSAVDGAVVSRRVRAGGKGVGAGTLTARGLTHVVASDAYHFEFPASAPNAKRWYQFWRERIAATSL